MVDKLFDNSASVQIVAERFGASVPVERPSWLAGTYGVSMV